MLMKKGQDLKKGNAKDQKTENEKPTATLNVLKEDLPPKEYIRKAEENLKVVEKYSKSFKSLGPALKSQLTTSVEVLKKLTRDRTIRDGELLRELNPEDSGENEWKKKLEEYSNNIEWYKNESDEKRKKIEQCERQRKREIEENKSLKEQIESIRKQLAEVEQKCRLKTTEDEQVNELKAENTRMKWRE